MRTTGIEHLTEHFRHKEGTKAAHTDKSIGLEVFLAFPPIGDF